MVCSSAQNSSNYLVTNMVFHHITNSPLYPQSNGEAERVVKTIKALLNKALYHFSVDSVQQNFWWAESWGPLCLWWGKNVFLKYLIPKLCSRKTTRQRLNKRRISIHTMESMSCQNCTQETTVWINDHEAEGKVIQEIAQRSYVVHTPDGELQRNRRHLVTV